MVQCNDVTLAGVDYYRVYALKEHVSFDLVQGTPLSCRGFQHTADVQNNSTVARLKWCILCIIEPLGQARDSSHVNTTSDCTFNENL